jgi:transposase-like protein
MKNKQLNVISCPYCGQEYLPSEIYIPNSFLGKATQIFRKTSGKIDTFFGKNMDLKETYICDKCNTEFAVSAKVTFNSYEIDNTFKEDFVSKLNKKLILEEN